MGTGSRICIRRIVVGPVQSNCWIVWKGEITPKEDTAALVFDPGYDADEIKRVLSSRNLVPKAFVLTHAHFDHIGGLSEMKSAFPEAPIYIHENEEDWLTNPMKNLSAFMGEKITAPPADVLLKESEEVSAAEDVGISLRAIHVPGHSPGSLAFYLEPDDYEKKIGQNAESVVEDTGPFSSIAPVVVCGDTLFADGIGRTDLPKGESEEALVGRIREKLFALPEETVALPGHGPRTTIGREKESNPFCKIQS